MDSPEFPVIGAAAQGRLHTFRTRASDFQLRSTSTSTPSGRLGGTKRSRSAVPEAGKPKKRNGQAQMVLDFGQKRLLSTQCPKCGLVYQQGHAEDEAVHSAACLEHASPPSFSPPASLPSLPAPAPLDRIVHIQGSPPSALADSVGRVLARVSQDLGMDRVHLTGRHSVFMACRGGRVLGVAVVEPIHAAFRAMPVAEEDGPGSPEQPPPVQVASACKDPPTSTQRSLLAFFAAAAPCAPKSVPSSASPPVAALSPRPANGDAHEAKAPLSHTPVKTAASTATRHAPRRPQTSGVFRATSTSFPATLGVLQIWTHAAHRRQGIATALLEAARKAAVFGQVVPRAACALSQPTRAGHLFGAAYFGQVDHLVYAV